MPGFDGTGPMGQGPMTGGGRGYCAVAVNNAGRQPAQGMRNARGRGRCRGMRAFGGYGRAIPAEERAAES
ncbi:MAG: DUF5320 domain-containing protein [Candidatus Omnitrophota bacterium]